MVGLPYSISGPSDREQSWDSGTPFSNGGDIPIDPALSEPQLDPALMAEDGYTGTTETPEPPPFYPSYHQPRVQQYPQGPQGDPFAQPPPVYVPVEEPVPLPAKPLKKRKRPPARVNDCATCGGNDSQNKAGLPELMVSCVDCGQSVHPSCIDFHNRGDILRAHGWQCFACKSCNVCGRKGDEDSMLMCDFCDRGQYTLVLPPNSC
ncbi:hypothetical protein C8Q76DRAFT_740953 [Earliella scabrosa]|nr:hypothetical protein C8Q76DRAFT_740953 [Earliella scabrosa]